eukprot:NODE_77_length_23806_cov_0.393892.p1 type:complete len:376 gc:universal NODE_77_length_23806_cov_0.393892:9856-10983(+)
MFEQSGSYCSPASIIKQNGKCRMVIDYRRVNLNTIADGSPISRIDELIQRVSGYLYYTIFDYETSFNQIQVTPETSISTSFVTSKSQYYSDGLGQGLKQSGVLFQHTTSQVTFEIENLAQYIDDVIIYGNDLQQHLKDVQRFVEICSDKIIILRLEKSQICQKQVDFCGYTVSGDEYKAKESYIIKIDLNGSPTSKKKANTLLGMLGWIRHFIPMFEDVIAPIRQTVTSPGRFQWSDKAERALRRSIELAQNHTISNIEDGIPCDLFVDASKHSVGGALFQDGRLVGLFSRKLNLSMIGWDAFELKLFAIKIRLDKFGKFFGGNEVLIKLDNEAAIYLLNGQGRKKYPKIYRWIENIHIPQSTSVASKQHCGHTL